MFHLHKVNVLMAIMWSFANLRTKVIENSPTSPIIGYGVLRGGPGKTTNSRSSCWFNVVAVGLCT